MSATPQSPVGIVATQSADFVRTVLDFLEQRRVVVLLRDSSDEERMSITGVEEVVEPEVDHGWASWRHTPHHGPETAQFLFTSGTEGRPKGVELPHAALADVVERLNSLMDVTSEIREYVGIPVHHSFGFGRCRAIAAAGGRAFLPEHGFNPLEVADMLRKQEINAISAVPSLWRVLLDARSMFEGLGNGVRWIEIGSQYMSREEKTAVRELFPNATIVQHYGLTEASRSTFLEIHATEGDALESVGRGYGEVEVALTDDGRIKLRGPHVATRLWIDEEPTSAVDDDGWFETQDLGSIRDGYLFFGGRADDQINCGGIKLSPERLEAQVRQTVGTAAEFALSRKPDAIRGDGILISAVQGLDMAGLREAVTEAAQAQGVQARGAIETMEVESLPRTASGKVQRRKLTEQWVEAHREPATKAAAAVAVAVGPTTELGRVEHELRGIWKEALGVEDIGLDESFYDLGGDSLTALNVIMRMGRAGIPPEICRSIFQGATIRQLAEASGPSEPAEPARVVELRAIWAEALGLENIGVEESFYDLGGDSLTALNVIMRMGRAGIPPEICRSIFQGATIRQLAEASGPQEAVALAAGESPATAEPKPLNLGYANNIMVNAVRGVLMLFVISGHWSIAVFSRLPKSLHVLADVMAPLFSYGTPGFAVTFGVGLGYLQLPIFEKNPARVKNSMRSGLLLVGGGTVLLGLLQSIVLVFIEGKAFSADLFFVSFFSPLLFYTLGVATAPMWFGLTTRVAPQPRQRVRFLLGLAAASAAIQMVLDVVLADVKVTGFLQLLRLMLEAKFAYFDMMSLVFVGLALGTWIKHRGEEPEAPRLLAVWGLAVVAVALVFGALTGEIDALTHWPSENNLTKWTFYAGLVMLTISGLMVATRRYNSLPAGAQWLLKVTATVGQLSLLFYILGALPIPIKSLLELVGLPGPVALLASLGMFLGASYLLVKRVYSLIHD